MAKQIGVWIDHQKAVVVDASQEDVATITSGLEPHSRYSGSGGHPGSSSSQTGGSEKRFEARARGELDRYLDTVIQAVGDADAILAFGPGEAKHEFTARLHEHAKRASGTVTTENAEKLTDRQIIARVAAHFHHRDAST